LYLKVLSVNNLKISFDDNHVLDGFNLQLESGDIFALLGDSGSGKSSALRFIAGLERAHLGSVALDGNNLSDGGAHSVKPELREIGMVFQDYDLFPHKTD
jgi:iron(III) transport system ATP-binding protein